MTWLEMVATFFGQMVVYTLLALFTENTIFSRALGASTSLWMIRKRYSIVMFGVIMTLITTISAVAVYFILPLIESLHNIYYIRPLIYVAVISVIYIMLLLIANHLKLEHKDMVLMFIHRCAFNCAVLGALLLCTEYHLDLAGFIGFGIGTGAGFTLATYMTYIAYFRLNSKIIPKAFRGFPITLFYIGILSLAIYGMIGHELPV
jgi:electron transport complex protein RnfA